MYHDEKIINDVLCWRGTPDGDWTPYTIQDLSTRHVALEKRFNDLYAATADLLPEGIQP